MRFVAIRAAEFAQNARAFNEPSVKNLEHADSLREPRDATVGKASCERSGAICIALRMCAGQEG